MNAAITRSMSRYRHGPSRSVRNPGDSSAGDSSDSAAVRAARTRQRSRGLSSSDEKTSTSTSEKEEDNDIKRNRYDAMARLMGESSRSRSTSRSASASRGPETGPARPEPTNQVSGNKRLPEEYHKDKAYTKTVETKGFKNERKQRTSFWERLRRRRSPEADHEKSPSGGDYIEAGGRGIVPGIDAPVSAVSTGERKVRVQYQGASSNLSVNGSIQAKDLLHSAAKCLPGGIDPNTFILMESFTAFGIQRPIRNYEHVREIINSWVYDGDNFLFIVPATSEEALRQQEVQEVRALATRPPAETTFYLYHCQRGGKWEKRFLTVRSDGQIISTKSMNSTKEQISICHLSDYDIYSVVATSHLSKKEKPPKRHSFAIKSQTKASMFLSTENFVHYVSTNDEGIAQRFYRAVHKWRSWYLVNKLGAGTPNKVDANNDDDQRGIPAQRRFARERSSPRGGGGTLVDNIENNNNNNGDWFNDNNAGPFLPSGLLGRTYSQRQQGLRERERGREKLNNSDDSPSRGGLIHSPSLSRSASRRPGSSRHSNSSSMRSMGQDPEMSPSPNTNGLIRSGSGLRRSDSGLRRSGSGIKRSGSVKQQPQKPLVDLTPVYQEPPQHSRKGKGRGVKVEPGVALIDAATNKDPLSNGIAIPPSTTWRRNRPGSPGPIPEGNYTTPNANMHIHRRHSRLHHSQSHNHQHKPISDTSFTPDSLLGRSDVRFPRRGIPTGYGVATGDRNARKPLLDMSDANPFVEGSLLSGLNDMKVKS